MLNLQTIRVSGTNLASELYDWLETNITDWDDLSDGKRRFFFTSVISQLEASAIAGDSKQTAWLHSSYIPCYTCPIDLRPFVTV